MSDDWLKLIFLKKCVKILTFQCDIIYSERCLIYNVTLGAFPKILESLIENQIECFGPTNKFPEKEA